MNVIKVEILVRVPDGSRVDDADVVAAVNEALNHDAEYDDQSLWNWHEYDVEVKND